MIYPIFVCDVSRWSDCGTWQDCNSENCPVDCVISDWQDILGQHANVFPFLLVKWLVSRKPWFIPATMRNLRWFKLGVAKLDLKQFCFERRGRRDLLVPLLNLIKFIWQKTWPDMTRIISPTSKWTPSGLPLRSAVAGLEQMYSWLFWETQ